MKLYTVDLGRMTISPTRFRKTRGDKQPAGDPIFVWESQHVGFKVVAATGHHQGGLDDHYIILKDGLKWDEACELAKQLRALLK
jgi:hypothetical protein